MPTDRTIENLRRRLERWELKHLRQHAVELQERLEQANAEVERAWACAEQWREDAMEMTQTLMDAGEKIGLTHNGALVVLVGADDDDPLIERRGQPIEASQP